MATSGAAYGTAGTAGTANTLRVRVKRAYDLKDTKMLGKQDPYVHLELNGNTAETTTDKSGGVNPIWNETVTLARTGGSTFEGDRDVLRIVVYHSKTLLPDSTIGIATLPLSQMKEQEGAMSLPLTSKKGEPAGFIDIEVMSSGASDKTGFTSGTAATSGAAGTQYGSGAAPSGGMPASGGVTAAPPATFTTTEDQTRTVERTEVLEERTPVEKSFVVETKPAGERELPTQAEVIDVKERELDQSGGAASGQQRTSGTQRTSGAGTY